MISDPGNPIQYACVSKGSTVVAELRSGDSDLDALAVRCVEKAPQFHLHYSHTARERIYAFLMVDSFVYFTVARDVLGRRECLRFLERLRVAFSASILKSRHNYGGDPLTFLCFHEEFGPVFRCLLPQPSLSIADPLASEQSNLCKTDTSDTKKIDDNAVISDLKETRGSKKIEDNVVVLDKETRDMNKIEQDVGIGAVSDVELKIGNAGLNVGSGGPGSAQRSWGRQVRMILVVDIVVCSLLFGIWLSVCKGFQCIAP